MNTGTMMFDKAAKWKKRKSAGEKLVDIAREEKVSGPYVTRVLKLEELPRAERDKYCYMIQRNQLIPSAALDLVDYSDDQTKRDEALEVAIQCCKDRDVANEKAKRPGKRGRVTDRGKVTKADIRSAIEKVRGREDR
jgi:hypothetical protein